MLSSVKVAKLLCLIVAIAIQLGCAEVSGVDPAKLGETPEGYDTASDTESETASDTETGTDADVDSDSETESETDTGSGELACRSCIFFEDFEGDAGGFSKQYGYHDWEWGEPTTYYKGPSDAYSGVRVWGTNLTGQHTQNAHLLYSPELDLSAAVGKNIVVSWWEWIDAHDDTYEPTVYTFEGEYGGGTPVKLDGGRGSDEVSKRLWQKRTVVIDDSFAQSTLKFSFVFDSNDADKAGGGWYIDDFCISIVEPMVVRDEDFESDDGGFTVEDTDSTPWDWGEPANVDPFYGEANSGTSSWGTNVAGNFLSHMDGYLLSPVIDVTGFRGYDITLSYYQEVEIESSYPKIQSQVRYSNIPAWYESHSLEGALGFARQL